MFRAYVGGREIIAGREWGSVVSHFLRTTTELKETGAKRVRILNNSYIVWNSPDQGEIRMPIYPTVQLAWKTGIIGEDKTIVRDFLEPDPEIIEKAFQNMAKRSRIND